MLLLVGGVPPVVEDETPATQRHGDGKAVLREATLTLGFIRESVGVDGEIEVRLNSERPGMDAMMRGWLADQTGLVPAAEMVGPPVRTDDGGRPAWGRTVGARPGGGLWRAAVIAPNLATRPFLNTRPVWLVTAVAGALTVILLIFNLRLFLVANRTLVDETRDPGRAPRETPESLEAAVRKDVEALERVPWRSLTRRVDATNLIVTGALVFVARDARRHREGDAVRCAI